MENNDSESEDGDSVACVNLLVGPMYAGKTTTLLRTISNHQKHGDRALIIKHSTDTRYSTDTVITHDNTGRRAADVVTDKLSTVVVPKGVSLIAIDELHFFADAPIALLFW